MVLHTSNHLDSTLTSGVACVDLNMHPVNTSPQFPPHSKDTMVGSLIDSCKFPLIWVNDRRIEGAMTGM